MEFSPPPRRLSSKTKKGLSARNPNLPPPLPPQHKNLTKQSNFDPPIATTDDVDADHAEISTQLEKLALESGLPVSISTLPVPVVNFISSLATSKRMLEADVSDLRVQVHQLRLANDQLETSNKTMNAAVFSSEQDAAGARVKLESSNKAHKKHAAKLTAERDEYRALSVRLASRDDQYKATMRKMEVDYESLRKQLQKRVQQERKSSNSFKAFEVKGKLPPRDINTNDKAFLSKLNSSLEMRQSELLFENNSLRSEIKSLGGEVNEVVGRFNVLQEYIARTRRERGEEEGEGRVEKQFYRDGEWYMNGEYVENRISSGLHKKIMEVKERIRGLMRAEGAEVAGEDGEGGNKEDKGEIERMRKKVKELKGIIKQQDGIIQAAVFQEPARGSGEERFEEEDRVEMERIKGEIGEERSKLDDEWEEWKKIKGGWTELVEGGMAGTLHGGTPGTGGHKRGGSWNGSPDVFIPFDATPITREILRGVGVDVGESTKIKYDELFG